MMRNAMMALALAVLTPVAASANGYENSDYAGLFLVDTVGDLPLAVGGRMSISPVGKVVGDLSFTSTDIFGVKTSTTGIKAGYRHTLGAVPALQGAVWSAGGGLLYSSFSVEVAGFPALDTSGSNTDFYAEADLEMPVGRTGVAHGVVGYYASDIQISGGYTHYFTPEMGARIDLGSNGGTRIGGVYRF